MSGGYVWSPTETVFNVVVTRVVYCPVSNGKVAVVLLAEIEKLWMKDFSKDMSAGGLHGMALTPGIVALVARVGKIYFRVKTY